MVKDDNETPGQRDFSHGEFAVQYPSNAQSVSVEDLRQNSFRYMQDGFSIVDANGLHVDVNPAFCAMTGFSEEELIGSGPEPVYSPPEEREKNRIAFAKTLSDDFSEHELIFMRKNGERFPVLVVPFAIRDNSGKPLFYAATVKDITQRIKMESALRHSEVRYRKLFDSAGDAIVIMNDKKIVDVNKRSQDLHGYSRDHILSTNPSGLFPLTQPNGQDSRELFFEMVEASRSGHPQCFEWTGQDIDGTPIDTEVTLTTFTLDETNFTQLIIRDIGERKKIEEALVELNKTLENGVAQRTEELENAYAQLLQQNVHYRELAKRLTQAEEQERKRISRLLHDNHQQLIAAARMRVEMLQSGSHDPGVQNAAQQVLEILGQAAEITRSLTLELSPPILFGSGLVDAIKSLARRMEKEHQLEVIVLGSLPSTGIPTDVSDALFRAVREFLFNVVKHADAREARVNIALLDQHLVLTVEDEGVGFDASGTLESLGGYGLFSIQEQLSFLDGRLHITSASNRGTTCTVSIPMATEDASNLEIWPAVDSITIENTEMLQIAKYPIRILVVDDHEVARKALVQILTLAEYFNVVGEAIDGLDAIEKTRTLKPDVILMDVTMPKMNGVEATRSIMKEFPGLKVIGLSMHGSEEMESYMLAAGATSYLQKLTPVEQLFETIRGVMKKESVGPH